MTRQCPSCGGFCKKSGCERDDIKGSEMNEEQQTVIEYTQRGGDQIEPTMPQLEAFIKRAGFNYGWSNLESWARRMAEQAVLELNQAARNEEVP